MKLVVVESPTKARTLGSFLGPEFLVAASQGHLMDLPKSRLGVDVEHGFEPEYILIKEKKKIVDELRRLAAKASEVILATDPDREGEAIAWHIQKLVQSKEGDQRFKRIVFHEITERAVKRALAEPGKVNIRLVEAQQARRILDRLVGYKLSPLLWKKIRRGLSAGRVQSVALRLIVEREREIEAFVPEEFWIISGRFEDGGVRFWARLVKIEGKKRRVKSKKEAEQVVAELKEAEFRVAKIEKKRVRVRPYPPFITSTLQRAAANLFGWPAKRTMRVAQSLYEKGLITYHRTDATNLAEEAVREVRGYIEKRFGSRFLPAKPRVYRRKSKMVQGAHEAIRPTKVEEEPAGLGRDEARLYRLIFKRFVACQMADGEDEKLRVGVAGQAERSFELVCEQVSRRFEGWRVIYGRLREEKQDFSSLKEGEGLKLLRVKSEQKFTQPPPRYTEAMLIKALEERGIGRPSTYAPIISTIQQRQYVEKKEGRFYPTPVGVAVNDFLVKHFSDIVDYEFTAKMEDELDEIARGKLEWRPAIAGFYNPFARKLKAVEEKTERVAIKTEKTGRRCPKCKKGELVVRLGRFGKFVSCSRFPECDYKETYIEKVEGVSCPECGAEVVIRKTKKGKRFYGCSRWPKCRWASWRKPRG